MFKKYLNQILTLLLLFFLVSAVLVSCEKKENPKPPVEEPKDPIASLKKYTYEIMTDIYYWYKTVPKNIDPKPIKTVQAYFDTLMVTQDRWSWMMTGQEYISSEAGEVKTYGISIGQPIDHYNDYSLRVRFVYPNSPMSENGIKRGYELTHLNGTPVDTLISNGTYYTVYAQPSNSFTFKKYDGESTTFTATSRVVNTRSSHKTAVYGPADYPNLPHKVGYFHYMSFKAGMLDDIKNAMTIFKNAGIKELILDLRYNGGGDGRATSLLANYLAPASADKELIARREHNDRYSSLDSREDYKTVIERLDGSLNLDRLFILTTKGSASASEVILNGFKPLMSVVQVGSTTYGKPTGMYVLAYPEGDFETPQYIFLPICFFSVNSVGYGHYVDGIAPDYKRPDDLYHDFGLEDDWVKSIMQYITTGAFPPLPPKPAQAYPLLPSSKIELPEESRNYGIYKVNLKRD